MSATPERDGPVDRLAAVDDGDRVAAVDDADRRLAQKRQDYLRLRWAGQADLAAVALSEVEALERHQPEPQP